MNRKNSTRVTPVFNNEILPMLANSAEPLTDKEKAQAFLRSNLPKLTQALKQKRSFEEEVIAIDRSLELLDKLILVIKEKNTEQKDIDINFILSLLEELNQSINLQIAFFRRDQGDAQITANKIMKMHLMKEILELFITPDNTFYLQINSLIKNLKLEEINQFLVLIEPAVLLYEDITKATIKKSFKDPTPSTAEVLKELHIETNKEKLRNEILTDELIKETVKQLSKQNLKDLTLTTKAKVKSIIKAKEGDKIVKFSDNEKNEILEDNEKNEILDQIILNKIENVNEGTLEAIKDKLIHKKMASMAMPDLLKNEDYRQTIQLLYKFKVQHILKVNEGSIPKNLKNIQTSLANINEENIKDKINLITIYLSNFNENMHKIGEEFSLLIKELENVKTKYSKNIVEILDNQLTSEQLITLIEDNKVLIKGLNHHANLLDDHRKLQQKICCFPGIRIQKMELELVLKFKIHHLEYEIDGLKNLQSESDLNEIMDSSGIIKIKDEIDNKTKELKEKSKKLNKIQKLMKQLDNSKKFDTNFVKKFDELADIINNNQVLIKEFNSDSISVPYQPKLDLIEVMGSSEIIKIKDEIDKKEKEANEKKEELNEYDKKINELKEQLSSENTEQGEKQRKRIRKVEKEIYDIKGKITDCFFKIATKISYDKLFKVEDERNFNQVHAFKLCDILNICESIGKLNEMKKMFEKNNVITAFFENIKDKNETYSSSVFAGQSSNDLTLPNLQALKKSLLGKKDKFQDMITFIGKSYGPVIENFETNIENKIKIEEQKIKNKRANPDGSVIKNIEINILNILKKKKNEIKGVSLVSQATIAKIQEDWIKNISEKDVEVINQALNYGRKVVFKDKLKKVVNVDLISACETLHKMTKVEYLFLIADHLSSCVMTWVNIEPKKKEKFARRLANIHLKKSHTEHRRRKVTKQKRHSRDDLQHDQTSLTNSDTILLSNSKKEPKLKPLPLKNANLYNFFVKDKDKRASHSSHSSGIILSDRTPSNSRERELININTTPNKKSNDKNRPSPSKSKELINSNPTKNNNSNPTKSNKNRPFRTNSIGKNQNNFTNLQLPDETIIVPTSSSPSKYLLGREKSGGNKEIKSGEVKEQLLRTKTRSKSTNKSPNEKRKFAPVNQKQYEQNEKNKNISSLALSDPFHLHNESTFGGSAYGFGKKVGTPTIVSSGDDIIGKGKIKSSPMVVSQPAKKSPDDRKQKTVAFETSGIIGNSYPDELRDELSISSSSLTGGTPTLPIIPPNDEEYSFISLRRNTSNNFNDNPITFFAKKPSFAKPEESLIIPDEFQIIKEKVESRESESEIVSDENSSEISLKK